MEERPTVRWPSTKPNHRVFIVSRNPNNVIVSDTDSGKIVASFPSTGQFISDEAVYDPGSKRLYLAGTFINVFQQRSPNGYQLLGQIPTSYHANTAILVPQRNRYYVAVNHHGSVDATVQVYELEQSRTKGSSWDQDQLRRLFIPGRPFGNRSVKRAYPWTRRQSPRVADPDTESARCLFTSCRITSKGSGNKKHAPTPQAAFFEPSIANRQSARTTHPSEQAGYLLAATSPDRMYGAVSLHLNRIALVEILAFGMLVQ